MTEMLVRPTYFPTPTPEALPGTLLTAVTLMEGPVEWLDTNAVMESFNCLTVDSKATFPCPQVYISTPTQSASSTATTGGTLAAGTYRAVITAINSRGETVASNEISQVTTGATSTITWNWSNVANETGYRIYVTAVNGAAGTESFLIQVAADTTSYVWTGTPARTAGSPPPTTNTAVLPVTKTFNGPSWNNGTQFAVYGGYICKSFEDPDTMRPNVEAAFKAKETIGVARALMQSPFLGATDLTPAGGAVNPEVGMAILEGDAAYKYAGYPTIHVPRTIGSLLTRNGSAYIEGNKMFTVQGSRLASDAGYQTPNNSPSNTAPAAGEYWMYASGQVTVARSDLFSSASLNQSTNETTVLVERLYVAAVDCYTAAIRVKVQ